MQKMCKMRTEPEVGNWFGGSWTALEIRRLCITYMWSGREKGGKCQKSLAPERTFKAGKGFWVVCSVAQQCSLLPVSPQHQERFYCCRKQSWVHAALGGWWTGASFTFDSIWTARKEKQSDVLELRVAGVSRGHMCFPGNLQTFSGQDQITCRIWNGGFWSALRSSIG